MNQKPGGERRVRVHEATRTTHHDVELMIAGVGRHERWIRVLHQHDDVGNHRVCVLVTQDGVPDERLSLCGDWATYESIVSVTSQLVGEFLGFTDYYGERVVRASQCPVGRRA